MNMIQGVVLTAGLSAGLGAFASAGTGVGDVPKNLEQIADYAQTGAESFADFQGRAVLIEFFAYW